MSLLMNKILMQLSCVFWLLQAIKTLGFFSFSQKSCERQLLLMHSHLLRKSRKFYSNCINKTPINSFYSEGRLKNASIMTVFNVMHQKSISFLFCFPCINIIIVRCWQAVRQRLVYTWRNLFRKKFVISIWVFFSYFSTQYRWFHHELKHKTILQTISMKSRRYHRQIGQNLDHFQHEQCLHGAYNFFFKQIPSPIWFW